MMIQITAFLTEWAKAITQVLLAVLVVQQYFAKRATDKAAAKVAEVATKTEDVRKTLVESDSATTVKLNDTAVKLDKLAINSDKIHTLVNSNMGVQLRISASALRRVAEYSKDPQDIRIAEEAERLATDHESKQHKVDAKADAD